MAGVDESSASAVTEWQTVTGPVQALPSKRSNFLLSGSSGSTVHIVPRELANPTQHSLITVLLSTSGIN